MLPDTLGACDHSVLMAGPLTRAQLENGARGIAYRAEQLVGCSMLLPGIPLRVEPVTARVTLDPGVWPTISNALIQSALVDARALAYFFADRGHMNINIAMFMQWDDPVVAVAEKIHGPISRHLGHATTGDAAGEIDPGAWPIRELAVTLVAGLARFVAALDSNNSRYDVAWSTPPPVERFDVDWFTPSPVELLDALLATDPLSNLAPVSDHPTVRKLTTVLRVHLGI